MALQFRRRNRSLQSDFQSQPAIFHSDFSRRLLLLLSFAVATFELWISGYIFQPKLSLTASRLAFGRNRGTVHHGSKGQWGGPGMNQYKLKKYREQMEKGNGVAPVKLKNNGLQLGKDKENTAINVAALEELATKPLVLTLDRSGRKILSDDKVEGLIPWSARTDSGLPSAQAPLSWEEYQARYRYTDKRHGAKFGSTKDFQAFQNKFAQEDGKDDYRVIRTFTWPGGAASGGGPASIMLIGVHETSARSQRLAARAVYEAQPSALLVQLCRERVGRYLVMPKEHLASVANYARGFAATNPHRMRAELQLMDAINGDFEALKLWMTDRAYAEAVAEFAELPSQPGRPKLLCLGDVAKSRIEQVRKSHGNETLKEVPFMSARSKHLVRGLISMASMGHKVVVGVIDTDLLGTATTWLERAGASLMAVADASDIESGRESIAMDVRLGHEGRQAGPGKGSVSLKEAAKVAADANRVIGLGLPNIKLGAFLNEEGMDFLQTRQKRLKQMTRLKDLVQHTEAPKKWAVAEELYVSRGPEIPGPFALLEKGKKGLRFEFERLEIPDHYLRDAGMEGYAAKLWRDLKASGQALEPHETSELSWWAAGGGTEASSLDFDNQDAEEEDLLGAADDGIDPWSFAPDDGIDPWSYAPS
eukprot:TRINITY_DN25955_c0_g1_i1.p1 TRINITY_DN25955_c0_g1~~TRINITY_DN25955_c0_g1_i1.p1  ORF type:complete len:648 (+),score=136.98 TRINITY_DN25955_c0_g1_i1:37-1980(+)